MDWRERLSEIDRRVVIGAAVGVVMLAVALGVWAMLPSRAGLETPTVLKCGNPECRYVYHTTYEHVIKNTKVDSLSPLAPGVPCPQCKQNTCASAYECPKDHTVFYANASLEPKTTGTATPERKDDLEPTTRGRVTCPTCGWDPVAERSREAMKALGR